MSRNAGSSAEKLIGTLVAIAAVAAAGVASYLVLERLAERPVLSVVRPAGGELPPEARTQEGREMAREDSKMKEGMTRGKEEDK